LYFIVPVVTVAAESVDASKIAADVPTRRKVSPPCASDLTRSKMMLLQSY
jgi:hypothetical protein